MKRRVKTFAVASLMLIGLTACGEEEVQEAEAVAAEETADAEMSGELPVMWIMHEGDKYVFNEIVPEPEINMDEIVSTGTVTGEGDGAMSGAEVFRYEADGSLFIVDDTGPEEQWAKFTLE